MADLDNFSLDNLVNDPKFNFLSQICLNNPESDSFDFLNADNIDSPYNNSKFSCLYSDENEFCTKYQGDKRLAIMSLNVQSINAKICELREFIQHCAYMNCTPDVICIQETWNIIDDNTLQIVGYQPLVYTCRKNSQGGGVGL